MSSLSFTFEIQEARQSLIICGDINVSTFPLFEAVMQSFADNGTGEISIDLRQVHSFNSPAVGALVMLCARRRGHGGIMNLVCTPTGVVTTMIQRARLDTVLKMKLLEAD